MPILQKFLIPRHGNQSVMAGKSSLILKRGEFFIETPNNGPGTGHCKIKIGDGVTPYPTLPYAMGDTNAEVSSSLITFDTNSSTDAGKALGAVVSGAQLKDMIAGFKQSISLLISAQKSFTTITDGTSSIHASSAADTLKITGGTNTTVSYDVSGKTISISSKDTTYGPASSTNAGITKLYSNTGTSVDGTMTQNAITNLVNSTKSELNSAIGAINSFEIVVLDTVDDLPATGTAHTVYFVPDDTGSGENVYDEFVWLPSTTSYEQIGVTTADLSKYYTKTDVDSKISSTQNGLVKNITYSGHTVTVTFGNGGTTSFNTADNNTTYGLASQSSNGLMSAADKSKLDGITGQVTADKVNAPDHTTDLVQYGAFEIAYQQILLQIPDSNTINTHIANRSNPHGVTKAQVGLGNVDNTADSAKSVKYAASAGKATNDSAGQNINTTYIKNLAVSGRTITYTKGNGATGTITTQDTNTTYGVASQSSNGLMSAVDKKAIDREFFRMLPKGGTVIPAKADLNSIQYLKVGNYYNSSSEETRTLKNCPGGAFMMYVLSPLSEAYDNESTRGWVYRLRIYVDYIGNIFTQLVSSDSTAGNFSYGPWVKMTNADDLGAVSNTINTHIANKSNPHGVTKAQVGLGNVANLDQSKAIKSITRNGTTFTATALDGTTSTFTQQDNNTTYGLASQSSNGLMSASDKTKLDNLDSTISTAISNALADLPSDDGIQHSEIPTYVKDSVLNIVNRVKAIQDNANTFTFIAASDAHQWNNENVTNGNLHAGMAMKALAYALNLDCAMYLGDYTTGSATTTIEEGLEHIGTINQDIDEAFKGLPQLRTTGNHDPLTYSYSQNNDYLSEEELFPLIGAYCQGATYGSNTAGYCYRDFASKKIRVICLNTADITAATSGSAEAVSVAQRIWFAETLLSAGNLGSDWGIIIVSHHPLDWGGILIMSNIVQAYVTGSSVTVTSGHSYNFNGHNSAHFICQFHGHVHCYKMDKLHYTTSGTEYDAYRMAIPNMCFNRNNEYGTTPSYYGIVFGETTTYNKTANSAEDTAFCVVCIDLDAEKIYAFHYGAGYDRTLKYGAATRYSVTNMLTHVSTSNQNASVSKGDSYTATISATAPYSVGTITVTMGGVDITASAVSGSTITIAEVTGDITVAASGVLGNLINYFGYTDNQRLSSSDGGNRTKSGSTTIEYIKLSEFANNNTVSFRITGAQFIHKTSPWDDNAFVFYNASKNFTSAGYLTDTDTHGNITITCTAASDTDMTITITGLKAEYLTSSYSYLRLCGVGSGANIDIRLV